MIAKKTPDRTATLKKFDPTNCDPVIIREGIKLLILEHQPTDDEMPAEFEESWVRAYHLRKFGLFEDNAEISSEIFDRRVPFGFVDLPKWEGKSHHHRIIVFPISYVYDHFMGE